MRANQTVQKIVDDLVALGANDAGGADGGETGAAAPETLGGNGESIDRSAPLVLETICHPPVLTNRIKYVCTGRILEQLKKWKCEKSKF